MMTQNIRQQIRGTLLILGCIVVSAGAQLAIDPIIREPRETVRPPMPPMPTPRARQHVEGQRADILEFKEQDRLQGALLSMDIENGVLTWEHPAAVEPIEFARRDLRRVTLGSRLAPRPIDDAVAVRLTNGDLIFGRLTAIDEGKVRIDTWYAGRLDIERSMVSRITRRDALTGLVYDGPDNIAQWRAERGDADWQLKDGAFIARSNASLGRVFEDLPDPAMITFDLAWEDKLNALFTLCTPDVSRHDAGGYAVHVSDGHARLLAFESRRWGGASERPMTKLSETGEPEGRMSVELWLNRGAGEITLAINGVLQTAWSGLGLQGFSGKGIVFRPQNEGEFRLSALRIREWDGAAPVRRPRADVKEDTDVLVFANNDQTVGRVKALRDGRLQVETSLGSTSAPWTEVLEITFASAARRTVAAGEGSVVAELTGEGAVTLNKVKIEAGEIRGTSAAFGAMVAPLSAFSSLSFNSPDPHTELATVAEDGSS